jgi:hypothetical protein
VTGNLVTGELRRRSTRHPFFAPEGGPGGSPAGQVPFQANVELLHAFLARRAEIVEPIPELQNAARKPPAYLLDGALLTRLFEDCFFTLAGIARGHSRLRDGLEDAHRAAGFTPRVLPGLHNGLVDPAEMMIRGFHLWAQTRWPGRNGRVHYAHTLFNLYVIRRLALLSMRLWDDGARGAGDRLALMQGVLDRLWTIAPAAQPVFVRDARWLIPMAQSPATDELGPYFDVASRVAGSFTARDRLDVHRAGVVMAAGHLRSQIRHFSVKSAVPLDEEGLVLGTRSSNALDFALLIQDLVPLLEAYEEAWRTGDGGRRRALADAICQGMSPDPELFVNRVDLLAAYSMIEHLFVTTDREGLAVHSPTGQRHVRLIREYDARIGRLAKPLSEDCPHFRPVAGSYSPYGVLYGFTSDILEHMALKALQPGAVTRFSLEDVFVAEDAGGDKLAWVRGWRKLPHISPEVARLFDYPQSFADEVFDRLERALHRRAADGEASAGVQAGRLCIMPADGSLADARMSQVPALPARYLHSSDTQIVAALGAEPRDEAHLLTDRREGRFVLSYQTPGGWVGISKAVLTEVLGAGRDVKIGGLPPAATDVLKLMCPGLVSEGAPPVDAG